MRAFCTTCGGSFERESHEDWKRLCIPCFIKKKRGDEGFSSVVTPWEAPNPLKAENNKLIAQNMSLVINNDLLMRKVTDLQSTLNAARGSATHPAGKFIKENIKALLLLCHPDKHGNSKRATAVTSWLIDYKRSI